MTTRNRQSGAVLLVGLIILMTAMAAALLSMFSQKMSDTRREQQTAESLAQAKQALLGYAFSQALSSGCAFNCPRPGDLPCPDTHSLGSPKEGTPGNNADVCVNNANLIGRLPWRTLGLPDLRDGWGERLWYARSERFRDRARAAMGPLNPDTAYGQISVRASDGGSMLNTAAVAGGTGAVAVIIAPGAPLTRNDGLQQARGAANYLTAAHYLDCWGTAGCNIEDNSNFINGSASNGFIMGPIRANGREVVNDRLITISRDEMLAVMTKRVAGEAAQALEGYYGNHSYFPGAAPLTNQNCLGTGIVAGSCVSVTGAAFGRIPAFIPPLAEPFNGYSNGSWFQQNGWREFVFYAIAPDCANQSPNCMAGGGLISVNNSSGSAVGGKRVAVVVAGGALAGQSRVNATDKTTLSNYLEDENRTPADNLFTRRATVPNTPFNDVVATIPRLP